MQFFVRLDAGVLSAYQRATDWWHAKSGKNNFWLARTCAWLILVNMAAHQLAERVPATTKLINMGYYSIMAFVFLSIISDLQKVENNGAKTYFCHWEKQVRIAAFAGSLLFLGPSLWGLVSGDNMLFELTEILFLISLVSMFYFASCVRPTTHVWGRQMEQALAP